MNIKYINFGGQPPQRVHYNDAGADVFSRCDVVLKAGSITKVPLGIGLELPDGMVAFVLPRSGMSANRGITAEVVPIDSGYRGEIHAIAFNATPDDITIIEGTRIAQLVILPVVIATFSLNDPEVRGTKAFGSTEKSEAVEKSTISIV